MDEDNNKIVFQDENGETHELEIKFSFYSRNANKNYVFLTDNTYDDTGELNVYAYYESPDGQNYLAIEDDEELENVNKIIEKYQEDKIAKKATEENEEER